MPNCIKQSIFVSILCVSIVFTLFSRTCIYTYTYIHIYTIFFYFLIYKRYKKQREGEVLILLAFELFPFCVSQIMSATTRLTQDKQHTTKTV